MQARASPARIVQRDLGEVVGNESVADAVATRDERASEQPKARRSEWTTSRSGRGVRTSGERAECPWYWGRPLCMESRSARSATWTRSQCCSSRKAAVMVDLPTAAAFRPGRQSGPCGSRRLLVHKKTTRRAPARPVTLPRGTGTGWRGAGRRKGRGSWAGATRRAAAMGRRRPRSCRGVAPRLFRRALRRCLCGP
jgi:hypothetical protein